MIISQGTAKTVRYHIYNYKAHKDAIAEMEGDFRKPDINKAFRGKGGIPKPTEEKGVRLADNKRYQMLTQWVECIEKAIIWSNRHHGRMMQEFFFDRDNRTAEEVAAELDVVKSTLYEWIGEVTMYTAVLALNKGLLYEDRFFK